MHFKSLEILAGAVVRVEGPRGHVLEGQHVRGRQLARHALGRRQDAHQVQPRQLAQLLYAPAFLHQLGEQQRV